MVFGRVAKEHFKCRDERVGENGNGLFGKFMSLITFELSVQVSQFCGASFFPGWSKLRSKCPMKHLREKCFYEKIQHNFVDLVYWKIWKTKCSPVDERLRTGFSKQFFLVFIEVFEGKVNFSKNCCVYRLQTLSENFFPLGKNSSADLLKLCSTSTGKHSEERVFENTFFDLRTLSWSVSVSVVKILNKLVKTAFQVFRWKLSLIFFLQKITVFHHHRKFKWIVSAFWRKNFTCNVKTAF